MRIKRLSLLIAIAVNLLGTQTNAEQPNLNANGLQAPVWANEQVPIAWADCIPVPIIPSPMPNRNSIGSMGMFPFPSGFMPSAPYPNQGRGLPITAPMAPNQPTMLPPPSPFFNPMGRPAQKAPNQIACNNSDSIKLQKLQSHYNQAAAASKSRIGELQQALEDIQNQMTDSRGVIDELETELSLQATSQEGVEELKILQASYKKQNLINDELKKKLTGVETDKQNLIKNLDDINQSSEALKTTHQHQNIANYELQIKVTEIEKLKQTLEQELDILKKSSNVQSEKLSALSQTNSAFTTLQTDHQHQNITNYELEKKLAIAKTLKKSMQEQLNHFEKEAKEKAQRLSALEQTASKLSKLQEDYKLRTNEMTKFEKLLAKSEDTKNNLQTKLNSLEENLGTQTQKLATLEQESNKSKELQNTYDDLQKKLLESESTKTSIMKELASIKASSSTQAQQLISFDSTTAAFKELQTTYQHQNIANYELQNRLAATEASKNDIQSQIIKLNENAVSQAEKLGALEQTKTKFKVLQGAYELRTSEITKLETLLTDSNKTKTDLQEKLGKLNETLAFQSQQLTALEQASNELKILEESYKLRTSELTEFESLIKESDSTQADLLAQFNNLKNNSSAQAQKLSLLGETATEFKVLQEAYQLQNHDLIQLKKRIVELDTERKALLLKLNGIKESRNDLSDQLVILQETDSKLKNLQGSYKITSNENIGLKKKLSDIETNSKSLQNSLTLLEADAASQTQKLAVLGKSTAELNELQKTYKERLNEIAELNKKLTALGDEYKSLQAKLTTVESNSADQSRQLTALGKSATELSALQGVYKERNDENTDLKKRLAEVDGTYKELQTKLNTLETDSKTKSDKLLVLGQASSDLNALQIAYKGSNDANANLKKRLAEVDGTYKELQTKLNTLETDSKTKSEKLLVLGKASSDLSALQIAYKGSVNENTELKKKLTEIENSHKTLQGKLGSLQSTASDQSRKLTILNKSASELIALQSTYKVRNNENVALKKQLAEMQNGNKVLLANLTDLESNAKNQEQKLAALGKSTTELGELQKAYKARLKEIAELKTKLAKMGDSYKTLNSKLASAESNASDQARKITVLGKSATELTALKSSYKKQTDENSVLKRKMAEQIKSCNANTKACKLEIAKLQKSLSNTTNKSKSLLAKLTTFEKTSSDQARQITTLMATASELKPLKSAYADLNAKLVAATADSDNDGILDQKDKCPASPAGIEVDLLGCFADSDKDGVANSTDKCPTSPEGSVVNGVGCPPIKDADNDGIADKDDLCPTTKNGETVNNFGCTPSENITLKGVNFATGSATLTNNSFPILDRAAKTLINNPSIRVQIAGHTDTKGLAPINKRLSQRRANSVMIYLIKKGADANRLTAKGYGESQPIANNSTAEGRATNRRVEMKIK